MPRSLRASLVCWTRKFRFKYPVRCGHLEMVNRILPLLETLLRVSVIGDSKCTIHFMDAKDLALKASFDNRVGEIQEEPEAVGPRLSYQEELRRVWKSLWF